MLVEVELVCSCACSQHCIRCSGVGGSCEEVTTAFACVGADCGVWGGWGAGGGGVGGVQSELH